MLSAAIARTPAGRPSATNDLAGFALARWLLRSGPVSDMLLDPEELAAIQAAVRESLPSGGRRGANNAAAIDARPLALIADDRAADAGRPVLLDLASRLAKLAPRSLRGYLPGLWQLDVTGTDIIDGGSVRHELAGAWVTAATNPHAELLIVAQGSVIDLAAARRCGAAAPTPESARAPSAVSLRLFEPVGKALLESFVQAWKDTFDQTIAPSTDVAIASRIVDARTLVRATLTFSDEVGGRIAIYARPESLVRRTNALAAHRANAEVILSALGNVKVDVVVELGALQMTLAELRNLEPGRTHPLPQFVDSRVPVFCGGVLKAWGRPVVSRGVLAVQIISVVHGQGSKS